MSQLSLNETIQHNCDISDAKDNGIYSLCTLFLKFRNLYKWENNVEPWDEPDPPVLLDWIAEKEEYWKEIHDKQFQPLPVNGTHIDPFEFQQVNKYLVDKDEKYGAGYGRSMKSIFFLADKVEEKTLEGCPVIIMGREKARELASPFAMLQDGVIYFRKEAFRFYLWDQILEMRASGKAALRHALRLYGLLNDCDNLDREKLVANLDNIADREMTSFIYHEVGEMQDNPLDSETLRKIVSQFPHSPLEFLTRSIKDVLADTHPKGMVGHILAERKETSLGFYTAFLDGLRKVLFPEIVEACKVFIDNGDWGVIEQAMVNCRDANLLRAEKLRSISGRLDKEPLESLQEEAEKELLEPLGLTGSKPG